jgi:hypothetical protein
MTYLDLSPEGEAPKQQTTMQGEWRNADNIWW